MKGIVLEVTDDRAIVLENDGSFKKIKNNNYEIGQRIENKNFKGIIMLQFKRIPHITLALVLVLVLSSGGFAYAYFIPYSYVSIDINPSVQLEINWFGRVIDVEEVNKDAQALLKDLLLTNTDYKTAVNLIISEAENQGYLNNINTNEVMITVACGNTEKANKMVQIILTDVDKGNGKVYNVEVESALLENVKEAERFRISFGKLDLIQKYIETSGQSEIDVVVWAEKSVKEIMDAIKGIDDTDDIDNVENNIDNENDEDNDKKNNNHGDVDDEEENSDVYDIDDVEDNVYDKGDADDTEDNIDDADDAEDNDSDTDDADDEEDDDSDIDDVDDEEDDDSDIDDVDDEEDDVYDIDDADDTEDNIDDADDTDDEEDKSYNTNKANDEDNDDDDDE